MQPCKACDLSFIACAPWAKVKFAAAARSLVV